MTTAVVNRPPHAEETRVAAFFDLDGTLIAEPSLERRFFGALQSSGEIPLVNYFRWAFEAVRLFPGGVLRARHGNKRYLTGVDRDLVFRYVEEIPLFYEAIGRLFWHAHHRHDIVLVTGTLEPLAELAATTLECELEARGIETRIHISATALEVRHGFWTGRVLGDAMYGEAKRRAILLFARRHSIDLLNSHAYGNSHLDGHMLAAVGHPHAVNPDKQLAALANLNDWPIWHWHHERVTRPASAAFETKIPQSESRV